jgi:hypothetical protein
VRKSRNSRGARSIVSCSVLASSTVCRCALYIENPARTKKVGREASTRKINLGGILRLLHIGFPCSHWHETRHSATSPHAQHKCSGKAWACSSRYITLVSYGLAFVCVLRHHRTSQLPLFALLLQLLLLQGVYVVFTFGTINLHLLRDDLCGKERLICSWPRKNWSYYATDNHTPPRRLSALDLP